MISSNSHYGLVKAWNNNEMGLFIFNGSGGLSDEEIMLGTPDATEAKNLEYHVSRCAYRYRLFAKRQASQSQDIAQVKYLVIALIGVMLFTSPQIRSIFEWASKLI